jgi:hypothetical protein
MAHAAGGAQGAGYEEPVKDSDLKETEINLRMTPEYQLERRNRLQGAYATGSAPNNGISSASNSTPMPTDPQVSWAVAYPRPTNGIFVAITVINNTLASSGRPAM